MLRSLFAGISGLTNHQVMLDIVGNNIANVNTIGYKSQRVTFRELLSQTISGGSRPVSGGLGGTNPQQIGLGTAIQSIDTSFIQGNLQATGNVTDLAVEGDGFFIISDGQSRAFTRAGAFVFDGLGRLVAPGSGFVLQGIMADTDGVIDLGKSLEDITVLDNLVAPAQATASVTMAGNLDADSDAVGSIIQSKRYLSVAENLNLLGDLYSGGNGEALNIQPGDTITISGTVGTSAVTGSFSVQNTSTVIDLVNWLNTVSPTEALFGLDPLTGSIDVTAIGTSDLRDLALTAGGKTVFNSAFAFDNNIPAGTGGSTAQELRGPAQSNDLLATLYDSSGTKISLPIGGFIQIDGDLGNVGITPFTFTYDINTTTVQDLMDNIDQAFSISNTTGVTLDGQGSIIISGDPSTAAEISNIQLSIPNQNDASFASAFDVTTVQFARDPQQWRTTSTVYDSLGRDFQVGFTFTKQTGTNTWDWVVDTPATISVLQGGAGTVQFDDEGRLQAFNFTDGSGQLGLDPGNGAQQMSINLDPGKFGGLSGLLQFKGGFTATARDFDGHGVGTLQSLSVDDRGIISGQFSNGINRSIAQVALAEFTNSSGLLRAGNGLFSTSANTGPENITFVGVNSSGTISPGQLEMSNVDLAAEFTQMIIAQRGFQANARIISAGDQILADLVSLGR